MKTIFAILLFCGSAFAACHVITATGSGSNSGADWNNACNGFAGACSMNTGAVRGDSYYVAKGSYSPAFFNKANSGTTLITVKAVTSGDHCTDTGYNAGTMFGVAKFTGQATIATDHWVIDGQYSTIRVKGSYGFMCDLTGVTGINGCFYTTTGGTDVTFKNLEIKGTNNTNVCESGIWADGWKASSRPSGLMMDHIYSYGSNSMTKMNTMANVTLQYSVVDQNYEDATNCHGEPIATNDTTNFIIRYNQFINCVGTGCIATPCGTCNPGTAEIYGNVFATDQTAGILSDGVIVALSSGGWTQFKAYNNTVSGWQLSQLRISPLNFMYNSGGTFGTCNEENTLFYNNSDGIIVGAGGCTCLSNSFYSNTRGSSACTGDQTGGAGNPFTNWQSDWHLVADTSSWSSLSSPYNTDPDAVTRTSSRGAYQFLTSGPNTSYAPTSWDFGSVSVGVPSTTEAIVLSNVGTGTLNISSIAVTGTNSSMFAITVNTCGSTLTAGNTCSVTLQFTPTSTGAKTASLTVTSDAPTSPDNVSLTGTGISSVGAPVPAIFAGQAVMSGAMAR